MARHSCKQVPGEQKGKCDPSGRKAKILLSKDKEPNEQKEMLQNWLQEVNEKLISIKQELKEKIDESNERQIVELEKQIENPKPTISEHARTLKTGSDR